MQQVSKVLSTCGYNLREVKINIDAKLDIYYFKVKGFDFSIEGNLLGKKEELSVRTTRIIEPRNEDYEDFGEEH